jgi:8-oxo-dGTP pyrophosphatase MutT (NUDIX family)
MVEITRHFVTSTFVVFNNKVLLHKHKKLNLILPLGGHIDRDELPTVAAIREVREESGLDVELFLSKILEKYPDESFELNQGEYTHVHKINEFHEHICFVYFAKGFTKKLSPKKGESKELIWYSKEEIIQSTYLAKNVQKYALEALKKIDL